MPNRALPCSRTSKRSRKPTLRRRTAGATDISAVMPPSTRPWLPQVSRKSIRLFPAPTWSC